MATMQLIRGTTPIIVMTFKEQMDFSVVSSIWVYISQSNKVKVDKKIEDVVFDSEENTATVTLTQNDTLGLKSGDALFQVRVLLEDGTALASIASKVTVIEVYKGGVIE